MDISVAAPVIGAGFAVGLLGSTHCVGMCGPFAAASAKSVGWRGTTAYSGGRIVTYGVLGAVAGALGAMLSVLRVVGFVATALVLFVVVLQLAGVLPEWKLPPSLFGRLMKKSQGWGRYGARIGLGLATALLPCGLVYAAMGVAVTGGDTLTGIATMVAFGIGTSPALIAVGAGLQRLTKVGPGARQVLAAVVAVAGLWALSQRVPDLEGQRTDCCSGAETAPAGEQPVDNE